MNSQTSRVSITYMSGPNDGQTVTWSNANDDPAFVLTIGRREGCDIALDYDTQVSRVHARLIFERKRQSFFLEDAGSRNGTYIGAKRLDKNRVTIKPGDMFRVGRTWMRLEFGYPPADHYRW
jgi:pSer/pThr/pTyr-binding forkhead associated (FHA) protein